MALRYEFNADVEDWHIAIEGRGTYVLEKIDARWRIRPYTYVWKSKAIARL